MGGIRFRKKFSFLVILFSTLLSLGTAWTLPVSLEQISVVAERPAAMPVMEFEENLSGQLELRDQEISLHLLSKGGVTIKFGLEPPYIGELFLDHVEVLDLPVMMRVLFEGQESPFNGKFQATHFIIDGLLAELFYGKYRIDGDSLVFSNCQLGSQYSFNGSIGLKEPYEVSMNIALSETPVEEIFFLKSQVEAKKISGMARGGWKLTGELNQLHAEGIFEVREGHLGAVNPVYFSQFFIELDGELPYLNVIDSRVTGEFGQILAKGVIDLKQVVEEGSFLKQMKFYSDNKTIRFKGWDIQTIDDIDRQLLVGRNVGPDIRVSFKSYMNDEISILNEGSQEDEFEFEYQFSKDKRIRMKVKGQEEMVGLENRVRF